MDLAFASNAFKRTSLDDAIEAVSRAGYRGIELMADLHHAHPDVMSPSRTAELRRRLSDAGLFVSNVNAFTGFACGTPQRPGDTYHPTWLEEDRAYRQRRIDHTRRCIEMAAAMGCGTISLQPGGPLIGTRLSRHDAEAIFAEGIAACVETARACGVVLAVEPEPGLLLQTSKEYLTWKRQHFGDDRCVRMNADLGHLFCVGEDPAEVLRRCRDDIAHVHVEDIGANRVHQHLTPGRGAMDFVAILTALKETGFTGRVTVELYPYEAEAAEVARRAMAHLRSLGW